MQIPPFELERWQSVWENHVDINVAESGVAPLSAAELAEDPDVLSALLDVPLGYGHTNGSEELRSRIAALYPGAGAHNVLVTCGCSEANFVGCWSLLEPGDPVVAMQPNYLQIAGLARGFGAHLTPLWLHEKLQWAPRLDELPGTVTPGTRLVTVCNPNNPTGALLSEEAIDSICAAAKRVGAWILADEVYRGSEHDGRVCPTFWSRYARVICTGGLSKAYGLPGLRIGWLVAPADMIDQLWGYHDYTTIGPTLLGDRLAGLALEPRRRKRILERTRKILLENYPVVRAWIERHDELLYHVPARAGAMAWMRYRGERSTTELAEVLRRQKDVLVVPGEQLGMESYLRIGFGGSRNELEQALDRIGSVLES